MVKTKIIATLGPASSSETIIREMTLAGLDVVRLNCSHGTQQERLEMIKTVRVINKKYHRALKILLDMQGPRIRIGAFKNHKPFVLNKKRSYWLVQGGYTEDENSIPFDYTGSLDPIKRAEYIYVDDGNIVLKIKEVEKNRIKVGVEVGGVIKEHKGINIPGAKLEFPLLSADDETDLDFAIENNVDYIAQSFVRTKEEIMIIRDKIDGQQRNCQIIAKIENEEGLKNLDEIIGAADGIMVARGDLGVSMPIYEIPIIQKHIIKRCKEKGKFVITATQMLESMTENMRPTRAEVTDVANSVIDGTDFVMLSAETAVGKYPVETVKMMNSILKYTEEEGRSYISGK